MSTRRSTIVPLPLVIVNAYLIRGERTVLVDTGFPGMTTMILDKLSAKGVERREISLILLTHGHPDHAGNARDLRERLGAPVAIHQLEADWMRAGHMPLPPAIRPFGHLIRPLIRPKIAPFVPDLLLEDGMDLTDWGVEAQVMHTPGHSLGSVSLLLPSGGCIVADLMAGGFVRRNRPDNPFFATDMAQLRGSIAALMAKGPRRLFFGHGLPSDPQAIRRRFARDIGFDQPGGWPAPPGL